MVKLLMFFPKKDQPSYLDIALEAKTFARQFIIYGATNLETKNFPVERGTAIFKAIDDIRALDEENIQILFKEREGSKWDAFLELIKLPMKYSIGNCGKLCFLGLYYLMQHYSSILCEMVEVHAFDGVHNCLVIGRPKGSLRDKPDTWNDAVICDPWANKDYPAKAHKTHLEAFEALVNQDVTYGFYLESYTRALTKSDQVHVVSAFNSQILLESKRLSDRQKPTLINALKDACEYGLSFFKDKSPKALPETIIPSHKHS